MFRRRSYAGLPTTFGTSWGRPVTLAGDVGGRWYRPDCSSPDELRGLIVMLHGYGGNRTEILSRLASSEYRAAHRGSGFHVLSLQGQFTLGGANRTWRGNDPLLPQNTSYPWATSTSYAVGDRRTANGCTYYCRVAGISAASGTGPSGLGELIVDGAASWRWVANGTHDNVNADKEWIAGLGGAVPGGGVHPEGVVREFLRTSGCNIDLRRIWTLDYSTGGALGDTLLRHYSDLFVGCIDFAGCGPNTTSDTNWAAPARKRHRRHWHGTLDVTVNGELGVPGGSSSAAVGNHPSMYGTMNQYADDSGVPGGAFASNGQLVDYTSTAGQEAQRWTRGGSASNIVDVDHGALPVRMELLRGVGDGHIPTMNNNGHRENTVAFDEWLGTPG
jgi:hypothetical protein